MITWKDVEMKLLLLSLLLLCGCSSRSEKEYEYNRDGITIIVIKTDGTYIVFPSLRGYFTTIR